MLLKEHTNRIFLLAKAVILVVRVLRQKSQSEKYLKFGQRGSVNYCSVTRTLDFLFGSASPAAFKR